MIGRMQDYKFTEWRIQPQSSLPFLRQTMVDQLSKVYAAAVRCSPGELAPGHSHVWFMRYHNVRALHGCSWVCCCFCCGL